MNYKTLFEEIAVEIDNIRSLNIHITNVQSSTVPNDDDPDITFEKDGVKKAKTIKTCVLYVDIRNSTDLSKKHSKELMSKLYTAFTKSIIKITGWYSGEVRSIIGDRVMVVFPASNCYTNAVNTAISINHASSIINSKFTELIFECGIGIDFGEKLVIKTGIPKQGKDRSDYKSLIWVSQSANIASKLTDIANKTIEKTTFTVTYKPFDFSALFQTQKRTLLGSLNPNPLPRFNYTPETTVTITEKEFVDNVTMIGSSLYFKGGDLLKFDKQKTNIKIPPILITENVYKYYAALNPNENSISKKWWRIQNLEVKEYTGKIYGVDLMWGT